MKNIFTNLSIALLFFAFVACDKSDDPDKIIEQPEEEQPVDEQPIGKKYRIKSIITHEIDIADNSIYPDTMYFIYEGEKLVRINYRDPFIISREIEDFSLIKYEGNSIYLDRQYVSEGDTTIAIQFLYSMDGNKVDEFSFHSEAFYPGFNYKLVYDNHNRPVIIKMTTSEDEYLGQTKITYVNDKIETRGYWDESDYLVDMDTFFYEDEKLAFIHRYEGFSGFVFLVRKNVYVYNSIGQISKIDYYSSEGEYWGHDAFTYNEDGLLTKVATEDKGEIVEEIFYEYEEGEGNAEFFEFDYMYYNFDEMPTYTRKDNTKPELGRPAFRLNPLKF